MRGLGVRVFAPNSQPPHPVLLPHSASKTRVNALMGEKGPSLHSALYLLTLRQIVLRAFAHPALALCSDPQCQTAHPLVTVGSPAMTTRTCIAAMRFASGSSVTLQESLPRTDGRPGLYFPRCLCSPKREAERRTAHHGCRASMRRRGRGPINKRTARLSALLRGHAPGFHSRLGPGRASWNHRMQTGGPSPAPVQRAPRSPARAGRADTQTA